MSREHKKQNNKKKKKIKEKENNNKNNIINIKHKKTYTKMTKAMQRRFNLSTTHLNKPKFYHIVWWFAVPCVYRIIFLSCLCLVGSCGPNLSAIHHDADSQQEIRTPPTRAIPKAKTIWGKFTRAKKTGTFETFDEDFARISGKILQDPKQILKREHICENLKTKLCQFVFCTFTNSPSNET